MRAGGFIHRAVTTPALVARRGRATTAKSWVPAQDAKMEQAVVNSLLLQLQREHLVAADGVVPWYLQQLPKAYFYEVSDATRLEHLKGLTALQCIEHAPGSDVSLRLTTRDEETGFTEITILRQDGKPGVLNDMLRSMKQSMKDQPLHGVRAYTSADGKLTVNIFTYGVSEAGATVKDGDRHMALANTDEEKESLAKFLSLCHPVYVRQTKPSRFSLHRKLSERLWGTENVEVECETYKNNRAWITIAAANSSKTLVSKITALFAMRGLNIQRMEMDSVKDPSEMGDSISLIRFLVNGCSADELVAGAQMFPGAFNDVDTDAWHTLSRDLRRLKWLDNDTVDLALTKCPQLGMERAEVLTAFIAMLQGPLSKVNMFTFSKTNLRNFVEDARYTRYFSDVADLFLARFNPAAPLQNGEFASQSEALRMRIKVLHSESVRTVLLMMVDAVELSLRTNFFVPRRYALALRVDPSLMISPEQQKPFGVFFIHGQAFNGFHNRFQNIARGGLRVVSPSSHEQVAIESSRCYDECYGLSLAQNLKNKDIPEGGSKAVVLVDLSGVSDRNRHNALRNSVKAFTDALLDLIVSVEDTRKYVVDRLGFDELIYLGPDEQIIPEDINWIIRQAARRGYPIPAAFMSSKPLAGINHKEYGVTSEGVAVFLDVALRNKGIDPTNQEFTVKITGGPDGDVGGNLLRILFRDYGDNAKIVGIADGSGCAEDPAGLSHSELMRLFQQGLPISNLDKSSLSGEGRMVLVDTEDGIRQRNSMHNRIKSDVFVPAGGRPSSIHSGNWQDFLDPVTGVPSSPLIVEGANIFITPEARAALFEKGGVSIVKDSSANKCGVITSSYEICASMLLDESEFLEIKEELVQDVLLQLRNLARLEAELLFREYNNGNDALPTYAERLSLAIIKTKAAIQGALSEMERDDEMYKELLPLFTEEHLPKKLSEAAAHRVGDRIPLDYLRNAFASSLASKLLYREGIHFLESQPEQRLPELALRYYAEEKRMKKLINSVRDGAVMPDSEKSEVIKLLQHGGVRSALRVY